MGYDPDTTTATTPLTTRNQVINLEFHSEKRLDKQNTINCMAGRLLNWYDVGEIAGDTEQFSDLGLLYADVSGSAITGGNPVGDLYVDYTIELRIPRVGRDTGSVGYVHLYNNSTYYATATNRFTASPGSLAIDDGATLKRNVDYSISSNAITVGIGNGGTYVIGTSWVGSSIGAAPTISYGIGVTPVNFFQDQTYPGQALLEGTTKAFYQVVVRIDPLLAPSGGVITYAGVGSMVNALVDIIIEQIPQITVNSESEALRRVMMRLGMAPLKPRLGPARIQEIEVDSHV
jgi:hypothetical protein